MKGERKGWYLVAYDIADNKRLQRIHRFIKKQGVSAQKSLFFVRGTQGHLNEFMDDIARLMKLNEDDLRAYPIASPKKVWTFGHNPLAELPTVQFEAARPAPKKKKAKSKNRFMRLLGL